MTSPSGQALKPGEEEWKDVFDRICERFPSVSAERVAQALREHGGHAGKAAAELRELTSSKVKEADPDDIEHVSTLLSSPAMFKHACQEHFGKFDHNGDGVLQWEEVRELTNQLYKSFGLQQPSEGALHGFFIINDENNDGVLSEHEFCKFFEMFLRYAYFDVVKLRELVAEGQARAERRKSQQLLPSVVASKERIEHCERSNGGERTNRCERRHSNLCSERSHSEPQDDQHREPRHARHRHSVDDSRLRHGHRAAERTGFVKSARLEAGAGTARPALNCIVTGGVCYRRSPDYSQHADNRVSHGEVVRVIEHWVRTSEGWLPLMDECGHALFERAEVGVNHQEGGTKRSRAKPDSGVSKAIKATSAAATPTTTQLAPEEADWKDRCERLMERFPDAGSAGVLQALRETRGHAGKAASALGGS